MAGATRALRVTQVSFRADIHERDAEALLAAWPTLPGVASAVARGGAGLTVVQAAARDQAIVRDGVAYRFAAVRPARGRVVATVVDRVAEAEPDVVHVQGLDWPDAVRALARRLPSVPVLVQDHGSAPPRRWRRPLWRSRYRDLAAVAFTAWEQASPWIDARVLPPSVRVVAVLEGSTHFVPRDREAARRATGLAGDPCLLWTGRLDANKDPLMVLDAFERAAPRLPHARLWCCHGDAPLLAAVRSRIAQSPALAARVTLLGRRPHAEMESLFSAADFFVQGSHHEACGFSVIEALACGATPLVTDIPPLRRVVSDAGSLTPVGDAPAMAEAMVQWSSRDRAWLRTRARARFERALTYDVVGRELCAAYAAVAR